MGKRYTDMQLRAARPGKADRWLTLDGVRGEGKLLLRVSPDGFKRFYYRMPAGSGSRAPVSLALFDPEGRLGYSLLQARAERARLEAVRREHGDPIAYEKSEKERKATEARKAELERAKEGSLGDLLAAYVDKLKREGKASAREVENAFRLNVHEGAPDLIVRKAIEITPGDVHRILSAMVKAGCTRQVNKVRAFLHAAFNHATKASYDPRRAQGATAFGIESNPVTLTMRVAEFERVGERALSADELAAFLRHVDRVPHEAMRRFLRASLFLGGQRIRQLLRLRAADINLDARIIRLQDGKGRNGVLRDHLLPLTDRVREILGAGPKAEQWVFSSSGRLPLHEATVSTAVAEYSAWLNANAGMKPFSARDLRRTCETRMAELGISKDTRAQLLSHGISGVQAKHYDRHSYLPQKREALKRWEEYLDGLLNPECKVMDLNSRKPTRAGSTTAG